jgi:hypothetical protein
VAYQIHWEEQGAYKEFSGHLTGAELLRSVSLIHGDRRFDDLRYVINDFLAVDTVEVTEDDVCYIAAIDGAAARSNPNIRIALVVTEAQGTALPMCYAASPWTLFPTRIFHSLDEARSWATAGQPASKP